MKPEMKNVTVGNKTYRCVMFGDIPYVRKICYMPIEVAEQYSKICKYLNEKETKMTLKLIKNFVWTFQEKEPLEKFDELADLGNIIRVSAVNTKKAVYINEEVEREKIKKELKDIRTTMQSIVDYIKQKERKELHTDLHPRENPKGEN